MHALVGKPCQGTNGLPCSHGQTQNGRLVATNKPSEASKAISWWHMMCSYLVSAGRPLHCNNEQYCIE